MKRALRCLFALFVAIPAPACSIPRWPVRGAVTSGYGLRMRGLLPGMHDGVDIQVPDGTPVAAMKKGIVVFAGTMRGYGLTVMIQHGPNLHTLYAHLSRIDVAYGQTVNGRDIIALSGHTGDVTGPHLHFEIIRYGRPDDPVPLLGGWPGRNDGAQPGVGPGARTLDSHDPVQQPSRSGPEPRHR